MMRALFIVALFCLIAAPASPHRCAAAPAFDVLIRGGQVVDGTGAAGRLADVGIAAGKIVAVGDLQDSASKIEIDAASHVVCPGFIDLHSHADRGVLQFRGAENYVRQGVTTLVCGNCGSSPTDVAAFFAELRKPGSGPSQR